MKNYYFKTYLFLSLALTSHISESQDLSAFPDIQIKLGGVMPINFNKAFSPIGKPIMLLFYSSTKCGMCRTLLERISENSDILNKFQVITIANWTNFKPDEQIADAHKNGQFDSNAFKSSKTIFMVDLNDELLKYFHGDFSDPSTIPMLIILTPQGVETYRSIGSKMLANEDEGKASIQEVLSTEYNRAVSINGTNLTLTPLLDNIFTDNKKSLVFIDNYTSSLFDLYFQNLTDSAISSKFSINRIPFDYNLGIKMGDSFYGYNKEVGMHSLINFMIKEKNVLPSLVILDKNNQLLTVLNENDSSENIRKKILLFFAGDYYLKMTWEEFFKNF